MFLKTLKHDLINSFKDYSTLYLSMIVLAIFAPITIKSNNQILMSFSAMALAFVFVTGFILTFMNAINFLKRRLFEEGAYFNLTLPVSLDQTLLSKIFTVSIWQIVTVFIVLISVFIFVLGFDAQMLNRLPQFFQMFMRVFREFEWWQILLGILSMVLGLFTFSVMVMLVLTLVNTSLFRKTNYLLSILFFFLIAFFQSWINDMISEAIFGKNMLPMMNNQIFIRQFETPLNGFVSIALQLFWFMLFYGSVRYLFDKKLEI